MFIIGLVLVCFFVHYLVVFGCLQYQHNELPGKTFRELCRVRRKTLHRVPKRVPPNSWR